MDARAILIRFCGSLWGLTEPGHPRTD